MSTIIEDRIDEKGLKKSWVAKEVGIDTRTLYDWVRYNNIKQVVNFFKLLEVLDIPLIDVAEDMKKRALL